MVLSSSSSVGSILMGLLVMAMICIVAALVGYRSLMREEMAVVGGGVGRVIHISNWVPLIITGVQSTLGVSSFR